MADVSVPSLLLFIASIVIAAGVAGVLVDTVTGISGALDDRGADLSKEVRTDVEVISDEGTDVYDEGAGNLTVYVKNTGLRTVPSTVDAVDVLLDGRYQTSTSMYVVSGDDWAPGEVVQLSVTGLSLTTGDHHLTVIVDGDEEVFRFRHEA